MSIFKNQWVFLFTKCCDLETVDAVAKTVVAPEYWVYIFIL